MENTALKIIITFYIHIKMIKSNEKHRNYIFQVFGGHFV